MAIDIRLATANDAADVHSIIMDAYSEYQNVPGSSSALDETVGHIQDAIGSGTEHALVGFVDGLAIACVRYQCTDGIYFRRLAVRQSRQGKGFAKLLLVRLESLAMTKTPPSIWCKVRYSVPRNVYLYESLGYVKVDEERVHKNNGVTLEVWTMRKELSP